MTYVLGIDAGGTKTVGLLADLDGEVKRMARGGGANLRVHGELAVEKVIFQLVEDLQPSEPLEAVCLGIAGAHLDGQNGLVRSMLGRLGLRRNVTVVHDAHIALVAGAPNGIGIVVAAGTGSIAHGVDTAGQWARSGGWGYLLGDEGSAFWLGHAAIRMAIRSADGRDRHTSLFRRVCETLDLQSPADVVAWFYDQDQSRHRVARLAALVEAAAVDGDDAAEDLLDQAAHHLARAAEAVDRQLDLPETFPVVFAGGVFKACPSVAKRIERTLALPGARTFVLEGEPAQGAVTLARRSVTEGAQPTGQSATDGDRQ